MENIDNLGLYLKNLREEKKIPVAQVAQALKTKPETIQALEANDFQKIPAPTYVKGYLRSYANYLGIDSEHILAEYNRQYPTGSKQVLILQGHKLPRIGLDMKKLLIPASIIVTIIIALIVFIIYKSSKSPVPSPQSPVTPPITEQIQTPSPATITPAITTPLFLSARTLDNVWLRVYADGKLIFEGTLQKDEKENWQAQNEFNLRIGNPSKLNLSLNGKSLGTISPYGPVNVTINEKGIQVEK